MNKASQIVYRGFMRILQGSFLSRYLAKNYWRAKNNPCDNGQHILNLWPNDQWFKRKSVLEFGANWGGNLKSINDQFPHLHVTGIDINPSVKELEKRCANYRGVIGDEKTLTTLPSDCFDLPFTISVIDHIPSEKIARNTLGELIRVAESVVLLEPFIEGVHGDVSHLSRKQLREGLPDPHKQFGQYCYVWNYDKWLNDLGVSWSKKPCPLHSASLEPFYFLYQVDKRVKKNSH